MTENRWRALILLGRNTTSYKFALGRALLEMGNSRVELIRLDELSLPFASALCEHMRESPKQGAAGVNRALHEACDGFNAGNVDQERLRDVTVRHVFGDVIDAFHVPGGNAIDNAFFIDERPTHQGIRVTDELRILDGMAARQTVWPKSKPDGAWWKGDGSWASIPA